jgi:hypothetical protein
LKQNEVARLQQRYAAASRTLSVYEAAALTDRGLTLQQISELDPQQLLEIYGYPRDKDGSLSLPGSRLTYEDIFRDTWLGRGYTAEQVDAKWKKYCETGE